MGADDASEGGEEDEDSGAEFLVWPENWAAVLLFCRCDTQWMWESGACTGLDYNRVEAVMRIDCIARSQRSDLLTDVRVLERTALPLINSRD